MRSKEFEKLIELEKTRKLSFGINRNQANAFWSNTRKMGRFLNLLTYVFMIATVVVFFKLGLIFGFISLIMLGVYTVLIQKLAVYYVRSRLISSEDIFIEAYEFGSVTIRNNTTSNVVRYPDDWRIWLSEISG